MHAKRWFLSRLNITMKDICIDVGSFEKDADCNDDNFFNFSVDFIKIQFLDGLNGNINVLGASLIIKNKMQLFKKSFCLKLYKNHLGCISN